MIHAVLNKRYKGIHGVLLVKNGKLMPEEYFYGYDRDRIHALHPVSKSITLILAGVAIDRGMISGVDKKVHEFFTDFKGTHWIDQAYDISLKHVLMMSAGIDWDERSKPLTDFRTDHFNSFAMVKLCHLLQVRF